MMCDEWTNITKIIKSIKNSRSLFLSILQSIATKQLKSLYNSWLNSIKEIFGLIIELSILLLMVVSMLQQKLEPSLVTFWSQLLSLSIKFRKVTVKMNVLILHKLSGKRVSEDTLKIKRKNLIRKKEELKEDWERKKSLPEGKTLCQSI